MNTFPSVDETGRIAALEAPFLRNLLITQSYYELSAVFSARTGARANWCTFATWASKQAGQSIRGEDLERTLEHFLEYEGGLQITFDQLVQTARLSGAPQSDGELAALAREFLAPGAALERAGNAVARGNRKVFAEIGHEFARFLQDCPESDKSNPEWIENFCSVLRSGPPPEGQQYLQKAFKVYYGSFFEADAKKRAESVLMANLLIGFHEQTRLQPEIAEALDAAIADPSAFSRRFLKALFPRSGWIIYIVWWLLRRLGRPTRLDVAIERYLSEARQKIRFFLTDHLMELALPHRIIRLGHDLPGGFPEVLGTLQNADLRALLQKIDPTPDSVAASGATDWADLPERMHFIADLFRCFQEAPELLNAPFTPAQVKDMKSGTVPDGPL